MDMPGSMPISLSAGGGTSGSSSNAGVALPVSTPFNFDGSGWVINFGDGNTASATGNKDANTTTQTPSAGGSSGLLGGLSTSTILLAVVAYLLLAD